jgi:hypothetical protein
MSMRHEQEALEGDICMFSCHEDMKTSTSRFPSPAALLLSALLLRCFAIPTFCTILLYNCSRSGCVGMCRDVGMSGCRVSVGMSVSGSRDVDGGVGSRETDSLRAGQA